MSARIKYALARFPEFSEAIKQYCADSRFFLNLCEDYGDAIEMLRRLEQYDESSASKSIRMCRDLVDDLEQEILLELEHSHGG
jgi:hypothetical protein